MRTILKYIGILLTIHCSMGIFAVESVNNLTTENNDQTGKIFENFEDFDKNFDPIDGNAEDSKLFEYVYLQSDFGKELWATFYNIIFANDKDTDSDETNMAVLEQKIAQLEQQFITGELYNNESSDLTETFQDTLLLKDEDDDIIDNQFNYLILYEEAIFNEEINIDLFKILTKNKVCPYKILYKKALESGDNKDLLIQEFSDLWNDSIKSSDYFANIIAPCFTAIDNNDLEEAFLQLNLKFSILKDFLGKDNIGIPNTFNELDCHQEYDEILNYLVENHSNKNKKNRNPYGFNFQKMYKGLSFNFTYIVFRMEFVRLFSKALMDFMNHRDFSQWIQKENNFIDFICFQSFFVEAILGIAITIELMEPLALLRSPEEIEMSKNIISSQYVARKIRIDILNEKKMQSEKQNEILYKVEQFKAMMDNFRDFSFSIFKKYFTNRLLWPSQEEFQSLDSSNEVSLTTLEKNALNLSNKLNTVLKSFFENPSSKEFQKTLLVVNKIQDEFLKLTLDLRVKYENNKKKRDLSWIFFLRNINSENFDLYNTFITNKNQYPHEEEKRQQPNEFSHKKLKQMSANQNKKHKKKSNNMEVQRQDAQLSQQKESMALVTESQKLILEAKENFHMIAKNKNDIYNSYQSLFKDVKNQIDICLNLMNKKGITEKNKLKFLIKNLESLKHNTVPLENIKDEINDTTKYHGDSLPVELESSYNLNKINQLIKKEQAKVDQFNRMIGLLTEAHGCLYNVVVQLSHGDEETTQIVVFEDKKILYGQSKQPQFFYEPGHIPKAKGAIGQEGPIARIKKKKKKPEEVKIVFKDGDQQQKEIEQEQRLIQERDENNRKMGAFLLKQELQRQAQLKSTE